MNTEALPSLFVLTMLDERYREEPYRTLDDLRARCPVHRDTVASTHILTRYKDVRDVLVSRAADRDPINAEPAASMRRGLGLASLARASQ